VTVSVEVSVPPEWIGGVAALAAFAAIDVALLRYGKATISRLTRYLIWKHPVAAAASAVALGLHLTFELPADPFRWAAGWLTTGDTHR
jgi:hypothetical protein